MRPIPRGTKCGLAGLLDESAFRGRPTRLGLGSIEQLQKTSWSRHCAVCIGYLLQKVETVAWLKPISLELRLKAKKIHGWDTCTFAGIYIAP